jgi:glycine/D-amino acid oxidase-like deaminating enzyme
MIGIDRYRTLFAHQPNRNWLRFDGGLSWHSADEADLLTEIHDHELSRGYDSQLLSPSEVAGRIPGVNPAAIPASGARWNPGEGWVDLPSLINHLVSELLRLGGELIINAGEASVVAHAGRATGVTMAGQDHIEVDAVLLATGAKVPQMVARFGVRIPDATPLALLVRTGPVQSGLRAVLNTPRASIRPTPEGALAVDSDWTVPYLKDRAQADPYRRRTRTGSTWRHRRFVRRVHP